MWKRGLSLCLAACLALPVLAEDPARAVYRAKGSFEELKQGLELAIANQGLVIAHWSDVAAMLSRTGHDLGAGQAVYLKAGVMEFCSAALSRKLMAADPSNIVHCPYAIALYVLPQAPDTVYLAYERVGRLGDAASQATLREVEALLERIVREAVDW